MSRSLAPAERPQLAASTGTRRWTWNGRAGTLISKSWIRSAQPPAARKLCIVMGDGYYLDIILFALVAAFLILRLRSVLGRRDGFQGKNDNRLPFPGRGERV